MAAFETERKVLFQHCDPAGIVFYPRYFEMVNAVVEEWFETALGLPFAEMHLERKAGVPLVRVEMDFRAPSRLGETLSFSLSLERLGESSMTCRLETDCGGERRFDGRLVLVYIDSLRGRAQPLPEEVQAKLRAFLPGA